MKRIENIANNRIAANHDDQWVLEVKGRILGISDLVAEESVLHKICSTKFSDFNKLSGNGSGRKVDVNREDLFDKFCGWLESEMENNMFTL